MRLVDKKRITHALYRNKHVKGAGSNENTSLLQISNIKRDM